VYSSIKFNELLGISIFAHIPDHFVLFFLFSFAKRTVFSLKAKKIKKIYINSSFILEFLSGWAFLSVKFEIQICSNTTPFIAAGK